MRIARKFYLTGTFALVALAAPAAFAQTTNATLVGSVLDPQSSVIAGATVTVKDKGTGVSRTVETDSAGSYRVFPLNPGRYEVSASMAGFKTKIVPEVILEIASIVKIDLALEVGQITDTVEVTATAAILQTQEASVGGTVTDAELSRLPVNGRNYTRLIMLMPGTSDQGGSQSKGTVSGTQLISVNGQRRQDNNYTLDGVDNNFQMMNSPGASPPMDAIEEFRVLNNTSAEFGRSSGANVNIAIKSGTRNIHGSLYEYLRNDKFDANDFFANRQGTGKVPFRQNQYGVAVGGPVVLPKLYHGREKTFWFASWEGFRFRRGGTAITTFPIAAQREGDFSQQSRTIYDPFTGRLDAQGNIVRDPFPGNKIPANRINPAIKFFVDTLTPLPNIGGALQNNYINTAGRKNDRDMLVLRGDHNFSAKDVVNVRYLRQRVGQFVPNANPFLVSNERFDVENIAAGWTHIFSATTVLDVKYGYNRPNNPNSTVNTKIGRGEFFDKTGIKMYQREVLFDPIPSLSAVGEFGVGGGGDITGDKINQWIANLSKTTGRHNLKTGINFTHRIFNTNTSNPMNGNGDFDRRLTSLFSDNNSGHSFATMLLGTPTEIRRSTGNTLTDAPVNATQAYVQDDWRVNNKLTVNIGLRWEFANPPYDTTDRLGNLIVTRDPQSGHYSGTLMWATVNPAVNPDTGTANDPPKQLGYGRSLKRSNYHDFAPRLGIAYQLNSKTVIRTAYGIFYNSTFVQELQDLRKFWPYTPQELFTANTGTTPDLLITDAARAGTVSIGGWSQNPENRTPYSQQWNFTIQRQLMNDLSVDIGYVGNANKHQIGYSAINTALTPGPGPVNPRRLMPQFGELDAGYNQYNSSYNSFRANAVKRFSKGLQFQANYTWGKALDNQSSLAETRAQNQYDRRADWGRSSIDLRHIFQFSYVYELPFGKGKKMGSNWAKPVDWAFGGWSLEGITRLQTGAPFNVTVGQDRANIGRSVQRPNVVRNPNNGGNRNVDIPWFDTSAFQLQPIYTYGNAGSFITQADGRETWDFAFQKDFRFWREGNFVQFRTEMFNAPNHVNMGNPQGSFASSAFGKVTSATAARQIQFGLRYQF
ncbi:MAG: carboxypeptidase-like regulatory domain-containing protein [Acidobacteriota bacterium]|nr:carboxypeptidase-like regulatory domain-containing protein [Acidobacteriota bacterium]